MFASIAEVVFDKAFPSASPLNDDSFVVPPLPSETNFVSAIFLLSFSTIAVAAVVLSIISPKPLEDIALNAMSAFFDALIIANILFVASWADIPAATNCAFKLVAISFTIACFSWTDALPLPALLNPSTSSFWFAFASLIAFLSCAIVNDKPCTPALFKFSNAALPFARVSSSCALTSLIELDILLYLMPASCALFLVIPLERISSFLFWAASFLALINKAIATPIPTASAAIGKLMAISPALIAPSAIVDALFNFVNKPETDPTPFVIFDNIGNSGAICIAIPV